MHCYLCGQPTVGDNFKCDDCRSPNVCDDCGYKNCICEDEYDTTECEVCGMKNGHHHLGCPNDDSPYAELQRTGYD